MPPLNLLIKPASGDCNLRCRYCFYTDEMAKRTQASYGRMSLGTAETLIQKSMEFADRSVTFAFQGGEPTLMGLPFFEKFCALVRQYQKPGLQIHYALQTNGTLLEERFCAFLARERFLVGLSLDGPRRIHDACRVAPDGGGSFQRVLRAARLLREARVDFNVLTVLTEQNATEIEDIYRFLMNHGFFYQQYIPCLDPLFEPRGQQSYSLRAVTYGKMLKKLFDLWYADLCRGRRVSIRYFDNLVDILSGLEPECCDLMGSCTLQYVVESDGSVYPCDFYALDAYRLGNLNTDTFSKMDEMRREIAFCELSCHRDPACGDCRWWGVCRGGCRRNREVFPGKMERSCFCEAYDLFFSYAYDRLLKMAQGAVR